MCDYCKDDYWNATPMVKNNTTEIGIEAPTREIYIDYDSRGWDSSIFRYSLNIKFCPMCGRDLQAIAGGKKE
jgi:hypothetical protein